MSPDYLSVQSCWRKPLPLFPIFFQVSNKFLRLLKPTTNSDKSISLKVSPFFNSNERLHKQKFKYHPFDAFCGCRSSQSWREKDVHGDFYLHPCRKPYSSLGCWFSFAHLLASQFLQPDNTKNCWKQVPGQELCLWSAWLSYSTGQWLDHLPPREEHQPKVFF